MRKIILSFSFLLYCSLGMHAQFNFSQINNQQTHNLGASQLPSLLGDDIKSAEIHLFSLYGGFANNFISAYNLQQLSSSGNLSNEYIDNILSKSPREATLWAGADIPVMNIFFNVRKKNNPFLSFGLGVREKVDFNFNMNKDLLSLIYKGNKQFADQTVNLSPSLNFLFYNEYFFAGAAQFNILITDSHKSIKIKPAFRLRYLNGMASIYMPNSHIDMYTHPDGRYIDFTTSLEANMSTSVDTPDAKGVIENIDFGDFKSSGKGMGLDLGIGVTLMENLQVHAAFIDIGSINFNRNTINYTKNDTYTYDGVDLDSKGEPISSAKLERFLQPEKSYNSYKMPLPTRLVLSGFYGLKHKTKRKVPYYVHNVTATYVQGFRNYLSATKHPTLNLGYAYSLGNIVNTGISCTLGGLNKVMAGAHMGFRLGALKFGFASNNVLPIITSKAGRGTDFNFYLGFYF